MQRVFVLFGAGAVLAFTFSSMAVTALPVGATAGCGTFVCVQASGKVEFEGVYPLCTGDVNTLPEFPTLCWTATGHATGTTAIPLFDGGAGVHVHTREGSCTWKAIPNVVESNPGSSPNEVWTPGNSCEAVAVDHFLAMIELNCATVSGNAYASLDGGVIDQATAPPADMDCAV